MGTMSVGRARIIALALVVCGVAVAFGMPVPFAGRVQAQQPTPSGTPTPVAVLDFVNNSGYDGDLLGRTAADALVLAMDESKKYAPEERTKVEEAMARLGFALPMGRVAEGRLAEALEVAYVAAGTINDVYLQDTRDGRVAMVDLTVVMLSANSGEYVNGARVRRASTPRPAYAGDQTALVDEALTLAAYEAVRTLISYKLPEATVLSATPSEVYLNAGSRSGLKDGMELAIMRFGEKVGRVRITRVEPNYATAAIVANYRGITPGDKALPVFQEPTAVQELAVRRAATKSKVSSSLLGIAAAAGIFFALNRHSPADSPVPGVAASSLSDPTGSRAAGILVTWGSPAHEWRNVRLYEIWRNDALISVSPAQTTSTGTSGSGHFFIDNSTAEVVGTFVELTLSIDATTGQVTEFSYTIPEEFTPSAGPLGTDYVRTWEPVPIEPGKGYVYRVVAIVATVEFSGGGGGTPTPTPTPTPEPTAGVAAASRAASRQVVPERQFVLRTSPYEGASGVATAVLPPELIEPDTDALVADAGEVRFAWLAVAGANDYVLQVSRGPLFVPDPNEETTKSYVGHEGVALEGAELSKVISVQDLPQGTDGVSTGLFYWRMGARNSRDPVAPRTDPALGKVYPQDQGYVWSTPSLRTFTITSTAVTSAGKSGSRAPRPLRWLGPRP